MVIFRGARDKGVLEEGPKSVLVQIPSLFVWPFIRAPASKLCRGFGVVRFPVNNPLNLVRHAQIAFTCRQVNLLSGDGKCQQLPSPDVALS